MGCLRWCVDTRAAVDSRPSTPSKRRVATRQKHVRGRWSTAWRARRRDTDRCQRLMPEALTLGRDTVATRSMTMTMTPREVQHLSMKAWPYRRECRGHDPAKKRICCTDEACSIGRVCTNPLSRTVCSTSNHEMNSKRRKNT